MYETLTFETFDVVLRWLREPMPPGGYRLKKRRMLKKRMKHEKTILIAAEIAATVYARKLEADLLRGSRRISQEPF